MMREPLAKRGGGTDPLLWAAAFGLMLIGAAIIFSASSRIDWNSTLDR